MAQSLAIRLMSANVGDTVTLHCFHEGNLAMHFLWYNQPFGYNPQLMSTFYEYEKNAIFYHDFKGNARISVESGNGINHLKISDVVRGVCWWQGSQAREDELGINRVV